MAHILRYELESMGSDSCKGYPFVHDPGKIRTPRNIFYSSQLFSHLRQLLLHGIKTI